MNKKQLSIVLVLVGIFLGLIVHQMKVREDKQIDKIVEDRDGNCYLADGTCLHNDRDMTYFNIGYGLSIGLILLGIYTYFDKTEEKLAEHQIKVTTALETASKKDEFKAFLSGFDEKEQILLKAIYEHEGIKQSTLRYKTNMSKTSLSIMLNHFEEKGIISRKKEGKTNLVFLVKKF